MVHPLALSDNLADIRNDSAKVSDVEQVKLARYQTLCEAAGVLFTLLAFSTFGEKGPADTTTDG